MTDGMVEESRFKKKKNGAKEARKANKRIQIIAGRLLRDIARKLPILKQYLMH